MNEKEETTTNANYVEGKPTVTRKSTGIAKWKIVLAVIVLGGGWLIFSAVRSTQGAIKAADTFVADLQAGRCDDMYNRSTSGFQDQGSIEAWGVACERVGSILNGELKQTGVEIQASSGEDSTSVVKYETDGNDGVKYVLAIGMVNQDGEWKMSVFDSDPIDSEETRKPHKKNSRFKV